MLVPILLLHLLLQPKSLDTGRDLYAACQSVAEQQSPSNQAYTRGVECLSYVEGYSDGLADGVKPICVSEASVGEIVHAYVLYLQKHTSLMDEPKRVGLYEALEQNYPCAAPQGDLLNHRSRRQ